jgi:hypothetical protein
VGASLSVGIIATTVDRLPEVRTIEGGFPKISLRLSPKIAKNLDCTPQATSQAH